MAGELRVAMVAPPWYELPPTGYGGIESMCADLTDGLLARGVDVTLIGVGSNGTRARFVQTFAQPQYPAKASEAAERQYFQAEARAQHPLDRRGPVLPSARCCRTRAACSFRSPGTSRSGW